MRHWTPLLLALLLVSDIQAQTARRLWVLQAPDQLVEYDLATFAAKGAWTVPRRVVEHPEYLRVNTTGQMVFQLPEGVELASGDMMAGAPRAWVWDGKQSKEWKLDGPQVFLAAGGQSLFWFENQFQKVLDADGAERSVRSSARVWRTDLAGGAEQTLVTIPLSASCQCTTGVCSESCPEWSMWVPDGVVGEFFLMTRFIPGQLETTYEQSVLYRRSGSRWQPNTLAEPLESAIAASQNGDVLISAVMDFGCCGWANEGNDQTLFLSNGKSSVFFDEWARFNNRNYDVSFYTTDARLAPGNALVAHTITGDAPTAADGDIRLSSDGKPSAEELARVRRAIADLPIMEIVGVGSPPRLVATVRRAAVVGWMSDRELLIAEDGHLVIVDASGKKVRDTPIRVRSAADALLR